MSRIKRLFGDTAIYGMSSIVGRIINFGLTPLYTRVFTEADNGVISDLLSMTAFCAVFFTFRIETAFFRFGAEEQDREKTFETALANIVLLAGSLGLIILVFAPQIANLLLYHDHPEYIRIFGVILIADALSELPFAKLRLSRRPYYFAFVKLSYIILNVIGNIFFIVVCKEWAKSGWTATWYNPSIGVGYVFIVGLFSSLVSLFLLMPLMKFSFRMDSVLSKKLWKYSWPLAIVGLAGIVNEMLDRQMLKYLLPYSLLENKKQLGIYAANYKLAMLISLFSQAFRYAAEPFIFTHSKQKDSPQLYARVAKYFTLFNLMGFLFIACFVHILKVFIGREGSGFHEGLAVVPILLMANVFLGLYYNISSWYKLTNRTRSGMWIALMGATITFILNYWWIPIYGYMGCAVATLICYGLMSAVGYLVGMQYYPLGYDWKGLTRYFLLALVLYISHRYILNYFDFNKIAQSISAILVLGIFAGVIYIRERKAFIEI